MRIIALFKKLRNREHEMIEKLKTTFMEVQKKHEEINILEKGTAKESRV